jgi:hypothetical protein
MRKSLVALVVCGSLALLAACEEGPEQIYKPLPEGTKYETMNGWDRDGHTVDGEQKFTKKTSEVNVDSTKLCEADKLAQVWTKMVKEPIVPGKGAGGLDLRGKDWAGLTVDDAQKTLCQAYVYSTTMVYWGDNAELIAFHDSKNRLIDRLVTVTGYEGTIKAGDYEIANNKAIQYKGKKLEGATTDANIRKMNIAFLKAFNKDFPNPEKRDCVAANTCYVMDWYTLKRYVFNDLDLDFATEPEGDKIDHIGINLRRTFDLTKTDVKFSTSPMPTAGLPPMPVIAKSTACKPTLGDTWKDIKNNCLGTDPPGKALIRAVWSNEAMYADMGGLAVYMQRPGLKVDEVIPDGTKAKDTDEIVGMLFNTVYEGKFLIDRDKLYKAFYTKVAAEVTKLEPTVDMTTIFSNLKPVGDATKLQLGTQKIDDCNVASTTCTETTLTKGVASLVQKEVKAKAGAVPELLMDPNFYVEILLKEFIKIFNVDQYGTATDTYLYFGGDDAQTLYITLLRKINGVHHGVKTAYDNKSDQLLYLFFKQGSMRTEGMLFTDAELDQYGGAKGDGVFRLWNMAKSPRIGLAKTLWPKKVYPKLRKATIEISINKVLTPILVNYHAEDSLSGYSIPVEGDRDKFVPASYYGFSGNVVGAGLWADDNDGIIKCISSGAFYDKLSFCGLKVGLFDEVGPLLKSLPSTCEKIISYSENGKIMTAVSTYVQKTPYKIGLRLWITAGRVDGAYYWAEQ